MDTTELPDDALDGVWQRARRAQRRQGLVMAAGLAAYLLLRAFVVDPSDGGPSDLSDAQTVALVGGIAAVFVAAVLLVHRFARRGSWLGAPLQMGLGRVDAHRVSTAITEGAVPDDPVLAACARDRARYLARWSVVSLTMLAVLAAAGAVLAVRESDRTVQAVWVVGALLCAGAAAAFVRQRRQALRYLRADHRAGTA